MSDDIIKKILDDIEHDAEREDSLRRMIASAFEARIRVYTLLVAIFIVASAAIAVWVAVLFFRTDEVRSMILYATVFNTCMLTIAGARIFIWLLLLRQRVIRELKKLELRLLEMAKSDRAGAT